MNVCMWRIPLIALVLGCGSGVQVGPIKVASPRFEFSNVKVDDSCSVPYWRVGDLKLDSECGGFLDYCVRAQTLVTSMAESQQQGTVVATYTTPDGKEVSKKQQLTLAEKGSQAVTFDFDEASVGDDAPNVRVRVDMKSCTRVACDVTNTGDAAGTASVQGIFHAKTKASSINLAPGQTRTLTFDFPELEAKGQGLCKLAP